MFDKNYSLSRKINNQTFSLDTSYMSDNDCALMFDKYFPDIVYV